MKKYCSWLVLLVFTLLVSGSIEVLADTPSISDLYAERGFVKITFSSAVSNVTAVLEVLGGETVACSPPVMDGTNTVMTITPAQKLNRDTVYHLTLSDGSIQLRKYFRLNTLLASDFDNMTTAELQKKWKVVNPANPVTSISVDSATGRMTLPSSTEQYAVMNNENLVCDANGNPIFNAQSGWSVTQTNAWTDYVVEYDAYPMQDGSTTDATKTFRFSMRDNKPYTSTVGNSYKNERGYFWLYDNTTQITNSSEAWWRVINLGEGYSVKSSARGDKFTFDVNFIPRPPATTISSFHKEYTINAATGKSGSFKFIPSVGYGVQIDNLQVYSFADITNTIDTLFVTDQGITWSQEGKAAAGNIRISNCSDAAKPVQVVVGAFSTANELLGIDIIDDIPAEIAVNEARTFSYSIQGMNQSAEKVRIFILDSLDSLVPYKAAIDKPYE